MIWDGDRALSSSMGDVAGRDGAEETEMNLGSLRPK